MKWVLTIIVLAVSAIFIFARLGRYALWDDEAITALTAKGVWSTGDTSATLGDNVLAYRNGLLLRNMKDRATPPLQFYLAAPFVGLRPDSALAARLPFAICGLGTIAIMLWWLHRDGASMTAWIMTALAILGNVSLFLFSRQARYYGLATLLAIAIAYCYLHVRSRAGLVVYCILSATLLAANYLAFAAVTVMLLVDYALFGRRRFAVRGWNWAALLGPQILLGAVIVSIWNPLRIAEPRGQDFSWLKWHATLLWWNLRDLNACEFGSGAVLLAAPFVWRLSRSAWLLRAIIALAVGLLVISSLTPQNPSNSGLADVRYLSFLIPLCIAIGVLTILPLATFSRAAAIALAGIAFGSNLLNFSFVPKAPVRSTVWCYVRELIHPVPEPYTPVAQWIRENVKPGESIVVLPSHMMYPLMFHAPKPIYGWQLDNPAPDELAHLPAIHRKLVVPPDYVVAFGPWNVESSEPRYELIQRIDVHFRDLYRPELFWRVFEPPPPDPRTDGVFIYRMVPNPSSFRL